jgi:3-phenylpropionate/cinnamic acid dioxygenase small subunit
MNARLNTPDILRAGEQFLFLEAKHMDAHDYDKWLELWHSELSYWVPCNADEGDPKRSVALIYDDRAQLEDRLMRLKGKHAFAQTPRSRLMRVVSNVMIESQSDSEVIVSSAFSLGEWRSNHETHWFGRNLHTLIFTGDGFRIRHKKVMLLNNDGPMPNITFII